MEDKLLLAKSISLLYRESQLPDRNENSSDLVRTVLNDVKVTEVGIGVNTERDVIKALKNTVLEMCDQSQDHVYDRNDLLQRIRINVSSDDKYYEAIAQGITDDIQEASIKRSIVNIRKAIHNHFREKQIRDTLYQASNTFTFERDKIKDVGQFISDFIMKLDSFTILDSLKDNAIMGDIDIGDDNNLQKLLTEARDSGSNSAVYKTGWQDLNKMLQGGFRAGETWIIPALQHKYKTGFTLSIFDQIPRYNNPKTKDPSKKPLLLRISFEDELRNNIQFMYQHLKYNETLQPVDVNAVSVEEMSAYIKDSLQVNGFNIKMLRVDPTQWTYKSICDKILEFEAQGYNIEVLMLDYLMLIPTTGCVNTGPMGTDMRDLLRRIRNFAASRGTLVLTPHQLSTEAKALIRSGLPEERFVKEINEKGYYAGSKQLDQEVDGELYIHLFKHNKETFLSVQRGKHRLPTIIPDEDKYFLLKFPKGQPIPDDEHLEQKISFKRLPTAASNADDNLFTF